MGKKSNNFTLSYDDIFETIKEDTRQTYEKITRDLAQEAKKDMVNAARSILRDFYDSYVPDYYVRFHNLYRMIDDSIITSHRIKSGENKGKRTTNTNPRRRVDNGYEATIAINPMLMHDNYNAMQDVVASSVWNYANRGIPNQHYDKDGWYWKPNVTIDGVNYRMDYPHDIMCGYLYKWFDIGKKEIKKIEDKYISNKTIKLR